jgi:PAS domain S-box-containing protein
MKPQSIRPPHLFQAVIVLALLVISGYNYLLFHTLAELFSIAVGWSIFMIAWNARDWSTSRYFLVIGVAYLFIGGIDLVHTLAYKGMAIFPGYDSDLPTQLWIAARYLESLSLAAALLLIRRPVDPDRLLAVYFGIFVLILAATFGERFPSCFVEGEGLTRFKVLSEYVICLILAAVLALLVRRRTEFDPRIYYMIGGSVLLTIGAELAFTFYVSVYGLSNLIGHLFKLGSYYLVYLALIENGLRKPYTLLMRELKQYEMMIANITDPVSYVDRSYLYRVVNDAYSKYARRPREEIIGMPVPELLGREAFDQYVKPALDTCFNGEPVQYGAWFDMPGKGPKFMEVAYYPIYDETGRIVVGAAAHSRDKTTVKAAEDAVRESEARFRTMFENQNAVMLLIDPEAGRIIQANRAAKRYYGCPEGKLEDQTIFEINQAGRAEIERKMEGALAETLNCFHFRHRLADGRIREVEIHSSPIVFKGKTLLFSIVHDITERMRVQRILEIYKEIVSSTPDAIAFLDNEYRYRIANDAYETFSNRKREDFIGLSVAEYLGEAVFREKVKPNFDRCLSGETIHYQDWFEYPTLGRRYVDVTYFPYRDEENQIAGIVSSTRDITDLKAAEEKLQEYANRLEDMVAERTRELQQAQNELLVKERLAVLGHFAGSISHEIRNPLAVIDSAAFFLKQKLFQEPEPEKIEQYLGRIQNNVKKATDIIESLLNLTRMEKPKTKPHAMADLFDMAVRSSKIPTGVQVIRELPPDPVWMDVDAGQVRMALKNLIQNAVQAMEGEGVLTLSGRVEEEGWLELAISDTGPGIPADQGEKVFEPLFTTKAQGIGFGLSITQMIVDNHDGTVRVESGPDGGARFVLMLPRGEK